MDEHIAIYFYNIIESTSKLYWRLEIQYWIIAGKGIVIATNFNFPLRRNTNILSYVLFYNYLILKIYYCNISLP